jgi:hypothetical protein
MNYGYKAVCRRRRRQRRRRLNICDSSSNGKPINFKNPNSIAVWKDAVCGVVPSLLVTCGEVHCDKI